VAYYIYKDSVYIGKSAAATFTVSGLTPAKSYNFYVRAKDAAGNLSKNSPTLTVKTLMSDTAPTATPTPTMTPTPTVNKVVGYYAAWAAYSGYTPDKIDATKLTHINYAFANIGSDLKITLGYPDIDPANISRLNSLKQINPALKTIISIGGWSWSERFSDAALTDASRTSFADSCVDFIVKYGFDGAEIDWEYPVSGGPSALCETFYDSSLIHASAALLERMGYTGPAMVEYRFTGKEYVFLEINPRIWGSFPLTVKSGSDFTEKWLALSQGRDAGSLSPSACPGKKMKYILNNTAAGFSLMKQGRVLKAMGAFADSLNPFISDGVFFCGDAHPFFKYLFGKKTN
jgi:hypothetical protein